jgi:hypothetical protein
MATSEHQLITPRRNFLIRALGFTAAGATVSVPVLLADNPQKRVDYHLQELTKALQEQYPEAKLLGRARCWEAWRGCTGPGDIIATASAHGNSSPFDRSRRQTKQPAGSRRLACGGTTQIGARWLNKVGSHG